jgi:hypothetical protein
VIARSVLGSIETCFGALDAALVKAFQHHALGCMHILAFAAEGL